MIIIGAVIGIFVYIGDYYHADAVAIEAMAGSGRVTVETEGKYTAFIPKDPIAGFIFYPGGKVEHTAYAPLLSLLAEKNILCVLIKMPANLAVLDVKGAAGVAEKYPQIKNWYIGGHSLGGSMAASYASNADTCGIVLLAAYSTADITDIPVLSLYGSEDKVMQADKYAKYKENLPADLLEAVIPGGNHAGFGAYGEQAGDGIAAISAEEQRNITANSIFEFVLRCNAE